MARKQAEGHHSRRGWGHRLLRATIELLTGPGRGVAATDFRQSHQRKESSRQSPGSPASMGLLREGSRGGDSTQDPQHQQVFEEFAGPSGLPSSSSSSANASSLLVRVRRPSSSFLWACSTSSVRRVKDWEAEEHKLVQCPHSLLLVTPPLPKVEGVSHLILAPICHLFYPSLLGSARDRVAVPGVLTSLMLRLVQALVS